MEPWFPWFIAIVVSFLWLMIGWQAWRYATFSASGNRGIFLNPPDYIGNPVRAFALFTWLVLWPLLATLDALRRKDLLKCVRVDLTLVFLVAGGGLVFAFYNLVLFILHLFNVH